MPSPKPASRALQRVLQALRHVVTADELATVARALSARLKDLQAAGMGVEPDGERPG